MTEGLVKLNSLIEKARMEFYKPIQVAEVLYHVRKGLAVVDAYDVESYRVASRGWRDVVTTRLFGKRSTSSVRYQDDVWGEHAMPPWALDQLIQVNQVDAAVERHVYQVLGTKWSDFLAVRDLIASEPSKAQLQEILSGSWSASPSASDRVAEILVLCLLNAELRMMRSRKIVSAENLEDASPLGPVIGAMGESKLYFDRLGHTNAADAGMDIWSNFGVVVSVKNRTLTEELFKSVLDDTPVGDLLVVCRAVDGTLDEVAADTDRAVSVILLDSLLARSDALLQATQARKDFRAALEHHFTREFPQVITFDEFMVERGYR